MFGRDTKESNKLHKSWRRSKFCRDVDKLLSGEQLDPSDETSPKTDDDDSEPEVEPASLHNHQLALLPPEDELSPSAHFTSPRIARPSGQLPVAHRPVSVSSPRTVRTESAILLPPNSWRLLDIYFAYTQSWLPICEKHDVMRVSYSYPEKGLVLSETDSSNSGDHAELWSIFAVAACQARSGTQDAVALSDPERLYNIARDFIPTESGHFAFGHVKALLNLAVVNLGRANSDAAWLLVGFASRILTVIEQTSPINNPRWKHLLAGCFLLDTLLSLQLRRRPYLQRFDLERLGQVEEDGLEEWQPWTSPLHSSSSPLSRTPVLSLSTLNKVLDVAHILSLTNSEQSPSDTFGFQQSLRQLESWKASLSTKFNYINEDGKQPPLNPPAVLLQLTYICCSFALLPSQSQIYRIIDLLEGFLDQLGAVSLPPTVLCLLTFLQMDGASGPLEQRLQVRIQRIRADIIRVWSTSLPEGPPITPALAPTHGRPSIGAYQIPTPESMQIPFNSSFTPLPNRPPSSRQRGTTSLLDDLLPDMSAAASTNQPSADIQHYSLPPMENDLQRPSLHHRNSGASRDLESFFDELASLDGAEKVDNQPQFMQNLGFAPDANMADFLAAELSQFIPANSTAFMPHNNNDPTQLDPAFFGAS